MPQSRWQKLRRNTRNHYWQSIRRINVRAYLRHEVDTTHEDDQWQPEQDLACYETREYQKRARRVHVTINDAMQPDQNDPWLWSYDGDQFLERNTLARFKKLVETAEYERKKRRREGNELWIKWFTAGAATVAAIASLYVAFFKK